MKCGVVTHTGRGRLKKKEQKKEVGGVYSNQANEKPIWLNSKTLYRFVHL